MPHWLIHLGVVGVFAVAVIDSSVIPLPVPGSTDLLDSAAGGESGESLAFGGGCDFRQPHWRLPDMERRQKGRRNHAAAVCAEAIPGADNTVGEAKRSPYSVSRCNPASTDSTHAVSAVCRSARGIPQPIPDRLRSRAISTVCHGRLAWRYLRTSSDPRLGAISGRMVGGGHLVFHRSAHRRSDFRPLEVSTRSAAVVEPRHGTCQLIYLPAQQRGTNRKSCAHAGNEHQITLVHTVLLRGRCPSPGGWCRPWCCRSGRC